MCLLLMNPEIYTAWNIRKKLFSKDLRNELYFIDLVLSKHPKRPSAWSQRAFVFNKLMIELTTQEDEKHQRRLHELEICNQAAERHRMNYHAWTYRWKLVSSSPINFRLLAFQDTRKYIQSHISEHSAFAHGLAVLESILGDRGCERDKVELFEQEIAVAMRLIVKYPGHKSPWCYLQGLYLISLRLNKGLQSDESGLLEAAIQNRVTELSSFSRSTVDGQQLSEVDILDEFEPWHQTQVSRNRWSEGEGGLLASLFGFGSWIIAASKSVIYSRGSDTLVNGSIWQNQIEVALDFQLYLLLGVNGVDATRQEIKRELKGIGGWPAFLLHV
ncbi:hypothetical protein BDR26DRAFT_856984 [Obelidium mucronatum]|nr:hypothetical protein BDR26DRAFT_856984 [Obelidium mucronatum]